MTASATLTIPMKDYNAMQSDIATARQEASALREELIAAKLVDPSDRVKSLTAFARDCLTITRFAVGNLPPEMIRGWPYAALKRVADDIAQLPDCSFDDHDLANELRAFAKECEAHAIRRAQEPPPTKFTPAELEAERQRLAADPVAQAFAEAKRKAAAGQ